MPRIPVHTLQTAPEPSRDALKALEAKLRKVLNIHGGMAHAPVVLNAYTARQQAISDHGTFDPRHPRGDCPSRWQRRPVHLLPVRAHRQREAGWLQRGAGLAIRAGRVDFDDRLAALLSLVRESASNLGHVQDETWRAALDAEWTDTELTEASTHIALNLFTNHFNHLVETDLDVPEAPVL